MATYRLRVGDHPPAWLTADIGEWAQISGATAPLVLRDFSGAGFRESGSVVELLSALSGGHAGNAISNEVLGMDLTASSPAFAQRLASGTPGTYDSETDAYFEDGSPGPRHLYNGVVWWPERARYIFSGRFWSLTGSDFAPFAVDGFNPATNTYDAAATYPNRTSGVVSWSIHDPTTGYLYALANDASLGGFKIDPSTLTVSSWYSAGGTESLRTAYGPGVYDTARSKVFHLGGSFFSSSPSASLRAVQIDSAGNRTAISFAASAGKTAFDVVWPNSLSPSLQYDKEGDCFYWYAGGEGSVSDDERGVIYKIIPNETATWDIEVMAAAGVTPANSGHGTPHRMWFVQGWSTLLLLVPGQDIYYRRVR